MNIKSLLENIAERYSDKTAVIFKGREITFSALKDEIFKLSNSLKALGINKGDKVGIYLPNCIEYICSYLACFCLGAVAVPLDFMLKKDELISCLGHSEAKILIAKQRKDLLFDEIRKSINSIDNIILVEGDLEDALLYENLVNNTSNDFQEIETDDNDPALIMYTSGTTGSPKGILLNYKHLEGSPRAMNHFVDLSDKDIKLAPLPLSHIGGFIYIQNCIFFGITLVLMDRFNPFEFLENIQKYKITCFHIVPPMYNAILTLKQIDRFDLSSLRWVVVFGAPSSPEIMKRFHKHCPNARLLNGWGMTETCPPNTVTPLDSDNIASVGKPSPDCNIKILDDEGNEVKTGEIGEIVISGWIVMDCYYKDEDATKAVLKDEGLHTGDLGKFDEDGFIYIVGRKKEMIKVGGQLVYAPEVESALYKHNDIVEAAVIGISDKLKGEILKAFVALKEGSDLSAEDIRYFVREHLANFKVPQLVEIMESLPKNRTGKIDKSKLKETEGVNR